MTDAVAQVKELTAKRDKARVALTRLQTQREAAEATKEEAAKALKDEFKTTPDKAPELLGELMAQRDILLQKAEEDLSRVNL
jgi:hypothetical protein